MTPAQDAAAKFGTLVEIMARLRAPGGCPWDLKQTFDTIKPYLLEETYEVMDAIDQRNWPELSEELGDLLLQPVFFAQMAAEEGKFTIADALAAINNKLIRRHPHVFADGDARNRRRCEAPLGRNQRAKKRPKRVETSSQGQSWTAFPALCPRWLRPKRFRARSRSWL